MRVLETRQCEPGVFADPVRARETAGEVEAARRRADDLLEAWSEAEEGAVTLESRLAAVEQVR